MRSHVGLPFALFVSSILVACASEPGGENKPATPPVASPPTDTTPPNTNVPPTTDAPKLEPVACRFLVPTSAEGTTFSCADLSVPENRRNPASRKIKIHVAIMKGAPGGVPTIELVGGPGGGSDSVVGGVAAKSKALMADYGGFLEKGDLILFDQRGTGRSIPRLSCDFENGSKNPVKACRDALEKEGIDVAAYDTVENADDVHDLKLALGVDKVDLHGISYGTRLGIEILKRHPNDVRTAILDGVMPSDVPVLGFFEVAMDNVLTKTFTACAADTKCKSEYPDLEATLSNLKKQLDATPFKGEDPEWGPYSYNWEAFVSELIESSYSEGTAARVPYWIHDLLGKSQSDWKADQDKAAADAEAKWLEEMQADAGNPLAAELEKRFETSTEEDYMAGGMATGMYLSVTCNDYAQHESLDAAKTAQAALRPELREISMVTQEFGDCEYWAKRPSDPNVRTAPTFPGSVLVIGGDLDPATPFTWAKHVADTLPNDQLVEVPTGGHGFMDACGTGLKKSFYANPASPVDATCATSRSIQFFYPGTTQQQHTRRNERVAFGVRPNTRPALNPLAKTAERVLAAALPQAARDQLRKLEAIHRARR